uniref:hypothetical protein n=1 Tax=Cupriavidus yeoncheonensis TaxID=1462994 RepID=UPI003F49A705
MNCHSASAIFLALWVVILSGCATHNTGDSGLAAFNPNPSRDVKARQPFTVAYNMDAHKDLETEIIPALNGYLGDILTAGNLVDQQQSYVSTATFLGALAATFGAIYEKTALILAGVGVGGAGYAVDKQYNLTAQSDAYDHAVTNLMCVINAANGVSDNDIQNTIDYAGKDEDRLAGVNAKNSILIQANAVTARLRTALKAAPRSTPSENDLIAYMNKLKASEGKPQPNMNGVTVQNLIISEQAKGKSLSEAKQLISERYSVSITRVLQLNANLAKCQNTML